MCILNCFSINTGGSNVSSINISSMISGKFFGYEHETLNRALLAKFVINIRLTIVGRVPFAILHVVKEVFRTFKEYLSSFSSFLAVNVMLCFSSSISTRNVTFCVKNDLSPSAETLHVKFTSAYFLSLVEITFSKRMYEICKRFELSVDNQKQFMK